ncbi:hypothetical protein D3C85_249800 [compost metagenome]
MLLAQPPSSVFRAATGGAGSCCWPGLPTGTVAQGGHRRRGCMLLAPGRRPARCPGGPPASGGVWCIASASAGTCGRVSGPQFGPICRVDTGKQPGSLLRNGQSGTKPPACVGGGGIRCPRQVPQPPTIERQFVSQMPNLSC